MGLPQSFLFSPYLTIRRRMITADQSFSGNLRMSIFFDETLDSVLFRVMQICPKSNKREWQDGRYLATRIGRHSPCTSSGHLASVTDNDVRMPLPERVTGQCCQR
jgi:hypothetical protein